jgi:hypothetical protein
MSKIIKNGTVDIYSESFGKSDSMPVLLVAGAMAPRIFWDACFCQALTFKGLVMKGSLNEKTESDI